MTVNCIYCIITVVTLMYVSISYQSGQPIYEQIKSQIRSQIFSGGLKAGTMLPSIRTLAKELQIGIITAKRAYDDLCAEGFCYSVQGKGVFVADVNKVDALSFKLAQLRSKLTEAKDFAEQNGVSKEELIKLLEQILGE